MSRLNLGNLDRGFRILAGLALTALAVAGSIGSWGYLGALLATTGVVAYCPLYRLLGFSTTSR